MKEIFDKVGATTEWRAEMLKKTAEASFNGHASEKGLLHPAGVVSSIAELNKMEGIYAPEKHAVLIEETENKVSELVGKYDKDY